ncbi:MAG: hypothetical protein ABIK28_03420 [Planctomycetota bacterium]
MRYAFLLLVSIITAAPVFPATFYVPDDYATIQAAIAAAQNSDIVIVRPGCLCRH